MVADKDLFINTLLEMASNAQNPADFEECAQRIRGALLINSSTSPDDLEQADGLAYGGNMSRQGPVLRGTNMLLSDVIEGIANISEVPAEVQEREPDLTLGDLQAALQLTAHILRAFEYSGR